MLKRFIPAALLLSFCFVVAVALTGNSSSVLAEEKAVKDVIEWDNPKWTLTFHHKKHVKYTEKDCKACHHKQDESKDMKCSGCHPEKKASPEDKSITYKRAMHKQCKDCHKEKQKGPYKKCSECHVRK